ncbi:unnamed protein product [Leptidea sinapis]|uniref:Uncharacterized protein n=1 Tax=Leptidea sinapis TaxID=189913 RepID=A0A5E4QAM7_9NEOP|nr:unnamed protein product [Leptidea sinapis]
MIACVSKVGWGDLQQVPKESIEEDSESLLEVWRRFEGPPWPSDGRGTAEEPRSGFTLSTSLSLIFVHFRRFESYQLTQHQLSYSAEGAALFLAQEETRDFFTQDPRYFRGSISIFKGVVTMLMRLRNLMSQRYELCISLQDTKPSHPNQLSYLVFVFSFDTDNESNKKFGEKEEAQNQYGIGGSWNYKNRPEQDYRGTWGQLNQGGGLGGSWGNQNQGMGSSWQQENIKQPGRDSSGSWRNQNQYDTSASWQQWNHNQPGQGLSGSWGKQNQQGIGSSWQQGNQNQQGRDTGRWWGNQNQYEIGDSWQQDNQNQLSRSPGGSRENHGQGGNENHQEKGLGELWGNQIQNVSNGETQSDGQSEQVKITTQATTSTTQHWATTTESDSPWWWLF